MLSSYGDTDCSLVILSRIFAEPLALVFIKEDLALSLCHPVKAAVIALTTGWANVRDIGQVVEDTTAACPRLAIFSEVFDDVAHSQAPIRLADKRVWLWRYAKDAGLAKPSASLGVPGQAHFCLATDAVAFVFHWACFEQLVVAELLSADVADVGL